MLEIHMKKPITTIDDLAALMMRTMASKEDVKGLEDRLTRRLDRIEHLLQTEQKQEIEDLKKRMKRLEDALAV
jgi:hypothetical protein